jgi:hypothetical protein
VPDVSRNLVISRLYGLDSVLILDGSLSMKKCNYMQTVKTWQEREVGCPLDHCLCGTHDVYNVKHECVEDMNDLDEDIRTVERAAGWDSNP